MSLGATVWHRSVGRTTWMPLTRPSVSLMPTVVRAADGTPGIIVPDGTPPDEVVVEVLKKGDGEVVTGDAPVRVHYTGVTYDEEGRVVDVARIRYRGDRFSFSVTVEAH